MLEAPSVPWRAAVRVCSRTVSGQKVSGTLDNLTTANGKPCLRGCFKIDVLNAGPERLTVFLSAWSAGSYLLTPAVSLRLQAAVEGQPELPATEGASDAQLSARLQTLSAHST